MAITLQHLEAASADLRKEIKQPSIEAAIALAVIKVYIKQQKQKPNGNNQ